ncbi:MAG: hypothetical protein ACERKZ_03365 [Lachnotalea sp.]
MKNPRLLLASLIGDKQYRKSPKKKRDKKDYTGAALQPTEERGDGMEMAVKQLKSSVALNRKKARADEANSFLSNLDGTTQKAIYIATQMFLAKEDAEKQKN